MFFVCKSYSLPRLLKITRHFYILQGMFNERTVKDFQEAIEQELGRKLEEKEATEILTNLVGYFDTLAKIDHREKTQVS